MMIISLYSLRNPRIIGNTLDIQEAMSYLKKRFEMKDLCKTKLYLGMHLEHLPRGVLIHHSTYTKMVLERFNMNNTL